MSIEINYVGHACFEIKAPEATILVDPFLAPNNPKATRSAADFSPDLVACTHGHVDHVADAEAVAKGAGATLLAIVEVANWFGEKGCDVVDPNLGGTVEFPWGWVRLVPALHTNTLPDGTVVGMPAGLVINVGGKTIYHLGDTALFSDLALVSKRSPVDVAIVPIGGHYTMDPEDAAEAVKLIGPRVAIPGHYNTFPPIEQDPQRFADLVGGASEVAILAPDESYTLE
jgi:L-ascorbate metabolism protein UlaG (beta-lactamase superfamily)